MHLASEHHSLGAGKAHVLRLTSYVLRFTFYVLRFTIQHFNISTLQPLQPSPTCALINVLWCANLTERSRPFPTHALFISIIGFCVVVS